MTSDGNNPRKNETRPPRGSGSRHGKPTPTPRRGLVEASAEDTIYWERTDRITRIRRLFKPFGSAVCSYVLTQSLTHKGIARVVLKLGMTPRNMEDSDLTQVQSWLRRNGPAEFCRVVGIRFVGESTEIRRPTREELESDGAIEKTTRAPSSGAEASAASRTRSPAADTTKPARSQADEAENSPVRKVGLDPVGLEGQPPPSTGTKPPPSAGTGRQTPAAERPQPADPLQPRSLPRRRREPTANEETQTDPHPWGVPQSPSRDRAPRKSPADPLKPVALPRDRHRPKAPPPPRGLPTNDPQSTNASAQEYIEKELNKE